MRVKEKEMNIPMQKDSESRSKRQSHPNELSENLKDVRWGERTEKEERIVELVGNQNPDPEAPLMNKGRLERREQRRC